MQHYLPKSTQTFGIALKRRLCHEQLTKEKIITIIAKEVVQIVPTCKVQLDNPEITIVVEICKTLCGISIVPRCEENFGNFNLAVAREKVHPEDSDE
jgi:tRNA acetyltransferase TAN1